MYVLLSADEKCNLKNKTYYSHSSIYFCENNKFSHTPRYAFYEDEFCIKPGS